MARQNYATLQAKINKEIEKLQKQAQVLQTKSRKPVISNLVRTMKEYDISPEELAAAYGKVKSSAKAGRPAKSLWRLNTATPQAGPPGLAVAKRHCGLSRPKKMASLANSF